MKTSFNTLSFIFFIPLMLLIYPLHSQAEEEATVKVLESSKILPQTKQYTSPPLHLPPPQLSRPPLPPLPIRRVKPPQESPTFGNDILIEESSDGFKFWGTYVSIEEVNNRIFDGKPVHFSENQEEGKRTIKSILITEAIEKGVKNIDIKNAIITGDLDFCIDKNLINIEEINKRKMSLLHLLRPPPPPLSRPPSLPMPPNRPPVSHPLPLRPMPTSKDRYVEKAYLISPSIKMENCQLQGNLEAGYYHNLRSIVIFEKFVSFINSKFVNKADFRGARFNGMANFVSASFDGKAYFSDASFNSEALFQAASFKKMAHFSSTNFNGKADFLDASFKEKANFASASFDGKANFSNASFKEKAYFLNASFKEKADFRDASFNGEAVFYNTTFSSNKVVDLRLARYPELQISWSQLKGRLDDPSLQKDIVSWQGVYLRLIRNFENIGDTKSADDAYYHYRYTKYVFCNGWWENTKWWFGYLFMGLTCGYGVIPWRTIATAGGLIAIFTFCIYFPFSKRGSLEIKGEDITKQEWYRRLYNCFYFSVIIFTTVGLGDIKPKGGFKAWAIAEGLLGWLTMALFLVTLANVWLR